MRTIITLVLFAVVVFLGYTLYLNIQDPIAFRAEKLDRLTSVTEKLEDIRTSQEMFRSITGKYAHTFDTLAQVLKTDSIPFVSVIGDPDDPTQEFIRTVTYSSAFDSIRALNIDLDQLRYVPFNDAKKQFTIAADTITYQQTLVHVVQVGTRYKEFMGQYANPKYSKYDNSYDPNSAVKFGDMNKPTLNGNWKI